ncbi:MAG TPA: peroxide stress protein YaaA, partial [Burkholderiaceae bacterium]|nr:peroxide stress protein YaaA [Burkholderiaceae bacterium]
MLIVLSPAKSLDYGTPPTTELHTQPDFIARSAQLVDILKAYSPAQIASLMRISDPLAQL